MIRFETGSVVQYINSLLKQFYLHGARDNCQIEKTIEYNQRVIEWNTRYIEYLAKGTVTFHQPVWREGDFDSDIVEDLYQIAKSISNLTKEEQKLLYNSTCMTHEQLLNLLKKYDYVDAKKMSEKLIELNKRQIQRLEEEIQDLLKQKLSNDAADKLTYMLGMTPPVENTDKVLKYERSLQKSIFQNLLMLKKYQGFF